MNNSGFKKTNKCGYRKTGWFNGRLRMVILFILAKKKDYIY